MKKSILTLSVIVFGLSAFADAKFAKIFSDNMVLQREMPVNVWGTSAPNADIQVKFGNHTANAKADEAGRWLAVLPKLKASKRPKEMTLSENGKQNAKITNVLVGEVWIASGQSNMGFRFEETVAFAQDVKDADLPLIRFMRLPIWSTAEPKDEMPYEPKWEILSAQNAGSISGIGYYFTKKLSSDLDVPVGMLQAAIGGSDMCCWTPEWALLKNDTTRPHTQKFKSELSAYNFAIAHKKWKEELSAYEKSAADAQAAGKPKPTKPWQLNDEPNPFSPRMMRASPFIFYHNGFTPIGKFAFRGALWYQGENDAGSPNTFSEKFRVLINAWRHDFGRDFPFVFAQLPSFNSKQDWAATRHAQQDAAKLLKNVYYANLIDLGEENDIHPKDKRTPAERLEGVVLKNVYARTNAVGVCPVVKNVQFKSGKAIAEFETFGDSLIEDGSARGFEVLVNGTWQTADAQLKGNCVILKSAISANANKPIDGVRYLWKNWAKPEVWLFNSHKIPADPFMIEKN